MAAGHIDLEALDLSDLVVTRAEPRVANAPERLAAVLEGLKEWYAGEVDARVAAERRADEAEARLEDVARHLAEAEGRVAEVEAKMASFRQVMDEAKRLLD